MKLKIAGEVYDFDPAALDTKEAVQLKVQAGLDYSELLGMNTNDPRVLTALIWLCRTRAGEKRLQYDDIRVPIKDIELVFDEPEPESEGPTVATLPPEPNGSPTSADMLTGDSLSVTATG